MNSIFRVCFSSSINVGLVKAAIFSKFVRLESVKDFVEYLFSFKKLETEI